MIKYFRQAFTITNDNIILTTPFILFLLIVGLFIGFTGGLLNTKISGLFLLITLLFMTAAFFSGWFYMVQKAIDITHENIDKEEKIKQSLTIIKTMTTGIGEFFISFVFGSILFIGLILLFILIGRYIGIHFIGSLHVPFDTLRASMMSNEQMKQFLMTIPPEELAKISKWNFLILTLVSLFSFITMFWACAIIKNNKNPILAFLKSIKFIGKNFLGSVILFIYISAINLLITALNGICAINNILYFIATLIYFYFVVYIIVLVFLYYDEQQRKPVEEKIEDNSNSGTDSIGEE